MEIQVIVWALFIWAGVAIAKNKNRNPWGGALAGMFGLIGLAVLMFVPKKELSDG